MLDKRGYVYILTNKYNTTLYTGITDDLVKRINEHRFKAGPKAFSSRYNLTKLVYYEIIPSIEEAIRREKQIKGWVRSKKIRLIEKLNPKWKDLIEDLMP